MNTVEKALSVYTDKIQAHKHIDLNELCDGLSDGDRAEFNELKSVIDILWQDKNTSQFDRLFDEIWHQWNESYKEPMAANFRTESRKGGDRVAEDTIEKLLEEVLKEDE